MHVPVIKRAHAYRSESPLGFALPKTLELSLRKLSAFVVTTICVATAPAWTPNVAADRSQASALSAVVTSCISPDPSMIDFLDSLVVSSDSDIGIGQRQRLQLPAGPICSVSAVTESATCHRAAIAAGLSRKSPDSTSVPAVSVVRVGPTRYVVTDTLHHIGEYDLSYTFDSAFTLPPLARWGS